MKKLLLSILLLSCLPIFGQVQVAPFVNPKVQFFNGGSPCSGCKLNTYAAGTTTPQATYSDSLGTVPNTNPVVLDSNGMATVYLTSQSYKFILQTSLGVTIWTQDNVSWNNLASTLSSLAIAGPGPVTINTAVAATSGANQSGPLTQFCGNFWNGSASAADCWSWQDVLGTGSNPTSTLTLSHSGSGGAAAINFPSLTFNNLNVSGALNAGSLNATGNANIGGTFGVTGSSNLGSMSASSATISGNETVGGTLAVTGNGTLAGISSTKVVRDCRQDGLAADGVTDDSTALSTCLANAATNNQDVNLPCANILVNTSVNDTNKPSLNVYGCGSSNPGITAGSGQGNTNVTTILCNTGSHPCLDRLGGAHSGWHHVNLVSRNSFSTPSDIAVMIGRDPALDPNGGQSFCFSEFMHDDDVYVLMESKPTANNNLGRIGYYNVGGAEIFRITSSDLTADRPLYLTTTNATVGASSLYQTIIGACSASMEGWESSGTAYTPISSTNGGAISLEGPTNGLHNFFSGDCIMKSGSASGDYCLQIPADGSYGIKMFPAFTVEQVQGSGGVAFFNGTCTDCTFDASTSSPSGMTNAWYQFNGGITTRGNSTAGIGAVDNTFAAHRVNPGDTPAPLLKCSGCGSPLVTLKGGRLELNSTTNPFSDTNTIVSGSIVIASGFTDSQVTFGTASKYVLLDDSGISIIGGLGQTLAYKRIGATNGSTVVAGDFVLSAGWGTTASKAFQGGTDGSGFLGVTSSGTGQAANPTITFTFHDGAWASGNAPNCLTVRGDANTAPTNVIFGESSSSSTQIVWMFNGTPVAGNTYSIKWSCQNK